MEAVQGTQDLARVSSTFSFHFEHCIGSIEYWNPDDICDLQTQLCDTSYDTIRERHLRSTEAETKLGSQNTSLL